MSLQFHDRRSRRRDEGSTHVLEAVIVASVMVSAVAFVVTYDQPQTATFSARATLDSKAKDALDILYDTPLESRFGSNALSAYVAECLNQRCTNLSDHLERLVPAGSSYALYLSNGYDTYPVLVQGQPSGEAVSATRAFEPDWSSTFLSTATDSVSVEDPLLVYALPIYHSMPVGSGGSQLLVKVIGQRDDGSDYVLLGSVSTMAQAAGSPAATAASLYFTDDAGTPLPVANLAGAVGAAQRLHLRLAQTETNGAIPADTLVTIHMPRGWTAVASPAANPAWKDFTNANDRNGSYVGSTLQASLLAPLNGGTVDLVFDATYWGDALDYYPFVATLSRGATAVASTILRAEVHSSTPTLATPMLFMSVPNPLGAGAQTTWTLSAQIPASGTGLPDGTSSRVHVTRIEISEQEGNEIFGSSVSASPTEAMQGTWTSTGSGLVWEAGEDVVLQDGTALNMTFRLGASGIAGPGDARSQFLPPVTFDPWTGRLVGRTGWGFSRQAILPQDDVYQGYDTTNPGLWTQHDLSTSGAYRGAELRGATTYNVSLAGAVEDSLYGSYVTAERRSVPVGSNVVINADVQSMLFALAEAGQRAGVTLRFYPPWSGDDRMTIFEQENLDQGLLAGEVSQLITLDINGDGFPDPVVGTSNGRVMAYHGLTGQRIQGNTYTVPLTEAAQQQQAVPRITAMSVIHVWGKDYIVVGTDKNSDGIFVLNTTFGLRWKYVIGAGDTLALNTTTDLDGGGPEILAARSVEVGASKNALIYALKVPQNTGSGVMDLVPIPGSSPPLQDPNALYMSLGTPSAILGQARAGPFGETQGVLVPIQTLADSGIQMNEHSDPPGFTQGASSTPRAGLQAINEDGEVTSTLFGAPASVLRTYNQSDDDIEDVLLGGTSGYVIMANGATLTQPIYSYIIAGAAAFVDSDTISSVESYVVDSHGSVSWTDDAWVTSFGPDTLATGANAIASDSPNSYWVVGAANTIWRSAYLPSPNDPTSASLPESRELVPVVPSATRGGVEYNFATHVHDFRDVSFRGAEGYIVGTQCALTVACTEPIFLHTTDGGTTWQVISQLAGGLLDKNGAALAGDLNSIEILHDGPTTRGWIVGNDGLVIRMDPATGDWRQLGTGYAGALSTSLDLKDIACMPDDLDTCMVVGEAGAAFVTRNANDAQPTWTDLTGKHGLPGDRALNAVGFAEDDRGYIGAHNMVLGVFGPPDTVNWTTLPLNYVQNDAFTVSTAGDGTGFVYGGSPANGRIWLLHDYATKSNVTLDLTSYIPDGSSIYSVMVTDGNISFAQQTIEVEATTNGRDWSTLDAPLVPGSDPLNDDVRVPAAVGAIWTTDLEHPNDDLHLRITLTTEGDKTILSPHIRALQVKVLYVGVDHQPHETTIDLPFHDDSLVEEGNADWDTSIGALHQPFVHEFWTRNVTGGVHDLQTGFALAGVGDARQEVWVATGDVVAENSPDHAIYSDPAYIVEKHDRVYLLDGATGHPAAISEKLDGEVMQIRLVDQDNDLVPETLFAITANSAANGHGFLYALDPRTLNIRWTQDLGREMPVDLEIGKFRGPHRAAFVGTARPTGDTSTVSHLWATNETTHEDEWAVVPDDLGKYYITTQVKPSWLYGPYVVEIEVQWEETATGSGLPIGTKVLRSARFYDHFMVTPPDAVSIPNPIYTAKLLMWMRDWGG